MKDKKELLKNPSFLQSVICAIAEERYEEEMVETEMLTEIGPGEQWDTKEDWMNERMTGWFNQTAEKIKIFPEGKSDIEVKRMSIDLARLMYGMSLGEETEVGSVRIIRVPGGWIYDTDIQCPSPSSIFVPYDDEYKKLSKLDLDNLLSNPGG